MPRPQRCELPDGLSHVYTRGNRRRDIFVAPGDPQKFLDLLEDVAWHFGWTCHAYCLMPNHVHLLLEAECEALSQGMQRLKGIYAQWLNRRHGLDGHVFQGRFGARPVLSDGHLLEVARYIVLNPVRAGVTRHPVSWPWSSYGATAGSAESPRFLETEFLLGLFGAAQDVARERYAAFVAEETLSSSAASRGLTRVRPLDMAAGIVEAPWEQSRLAPAW